MQFRAKQIAPPKNWTTFEDLCHALFKRVWQDPLAQKNGRNGQAQCGVDVFGSVNGDRSSYQGVQCKGKDASYGSEATRPELTTEITKAESFTPTLEHWVFATTAPVDGRLQEFARELSVQRKEQGLFTVDVLGWEEIQALIAQHPEVIAEFYPEHADHTQEMNETLKTLADEVAPRLESLVDNLAQRSRPAAANRPSEGKWEVISFDSDRGLGPALLGRPLAASDASACPRLVEADELASQLRIAFSARLVGEPGAGKSICSYQVARDYAAAGYQVFRLIDPRAENIRPPDPSPAKHFLLIDDAHLMTPAMLSRLEEKAAPNLTVLSTHNALEQSNLERGSVTLNARRAVRTIAASFRADLPRTLSSVRLADDSVGDRIMDEDISLRIDQAEKTADRPWQFCFILGGGWRRSKQAAETARNAGADFVLAAVAMRQLASRDAIAQLEDIALICGVTTISRETLEGQLEWLEHERLTLGMKDCRTPHQRFASVVLNQILVGQDKEGRRRVGRMIDAVLTDPQYPLAGLRNLLFEIRFGIGDYHWSRLPQRVAIESLAKRCWQAEGEDRGFAAHVVSELWRFIDDGARIVIGPYIEIFSRWISNPEDGAYGFAHLLNDLSYEEKPVAMAVLRGVDPDPVAQAFSNVSVESAFGLGDLLRISCLLDDGPWKEKVKAEVNRTQLLNFARNKNLQNKASLFGRFCASAMSLDEDLALDMAEQFIPFAQAALVRDPIEGFRELGHEFFMMVLGVFDPLGVFVGKHNPDRRRLSIARRTCKVLDPALVARQLSETIFRDFQTAAGLLSVLYRCAPKKYDGIVCQLNWAKLDAQIADDWANPSHETVVLLSMLSLSETTRVLVSDLIASRADSILKMPPRMILLAPQVGAEHVKTGKMLRLAKLSLLDWELVAEALYLIGTDQPDLVAQGVRPFVNDIAKGIESYHRNEAASAELLVCVLIEMAPKVWDEILLALDVAAAEQSLAYCLSKGRRHRRMAALVVDTAQGIRGDIGEMVLRLRKRFPKASIPSDTSQRKVPSTMPP
ncbi:MAG: hypothetical protein OXC69_02420 [Candidatus Tectomicrobia bacterium]|nr:hypothetical protein [Candidatus Tectomicrobia bacterium]